MMILNPVFSKLKKRVRNKRGLNIVICGEPGGGKSRRGLRLGEIFDENGFSRERVGYTGEAFIEYLSKTAKPLDAYMWDENIGGSEATNWYTEENKAVKRSMNIMRKKGITFIQCIPSLLDLQSGCRRLFHIYIEPMDFYPKEDGMLCKVMQMQHNPQNKITYFKYFRIPDPQNKRKLIRIPRIFISNPHNKELIDTYEDESEEFKDKTHVDNLQIIRDEKTRKSKDWRSPSPIEDHVLTVLNNVEAFKKEYQHKTFIDSVSIQNFCNVGEITAKRIKREVEKRLNTT